MKREPFCRGLILLMALLFFFAAPGHARAGPAYSLIGIVKGKDFIGAVLDDGKSGQTLYRLREQLPDGSAISKILQNSVTIRRSDGGSYDLFIVQGAKPSSAKAAPPVSRPNTPSAQPPANRAAPAIRAQPGRDGQANRRGKRRVPRTRRLRSNP